MNKLQQLEKEFQEFQRKFRAEIDVLKSVPEEGRAKISEDYFYLGGNGPTIKNTECGDSTDDYLWDIGNYFLTKAEGEKHKAKTLARVRVERACRAAGGGPSDGSSERVHPANKRGIYAVYLHSTLGEFTFPHRMFDEANKFYEKHSADLALIYEA